MKDYMIINTVPAYPEAPVSFEALKNNISQLIENVSEKKAEKKYLIVDKNDGRLKGLLEEGAKIFSELNIEIIEVDVKDGFVYTNGTAALKLIEGEKPIPTGINTSLPIYSVEELLDKDKKIVYLEGDLKNKGPYTLNKKTSIREILSQCGAEEKFKGIYLGYPMGIFMGEEQIDDKIDLNIDIIYIFDETSCILDRLISIISRYEKESCGSCVFGYEGVTQLKMILWDIAQKKGKSGDIDLLLNLCDFMEKQSQCEVGMAAAKTVSTALKNFRAEIEEHITKRACKAVVCNKFITYHIIPNLCTGCNECQDACEHEAILGKKNYIHVIDQDECVQCGRCLDACNLGAIVKAGPIKPRGPKKPIPCKKI